MLQAKIVTLAVCICLVLGCERRPPLQEHQARAQAQAWVKAEGVSWGKTTHAEALPGKDADDRSWWLFRYDGGPDGDGGSIWVNRRSGWVRTTQPPGLASAPGFSRKNILRLFQQGLYGIKAVAVK